MSIAFGPVPSRRLGASLGINNTPPKTCSYSCVYCQVGPKPERQVQRRAMVEPEEIAEQVEAQLSSVRGQGSHVDYLTFVPDGEPTLDAGLGRTIELLRPFGTKIAIITNGSLIDHDDVRADLLKADWVCLKVDTVDERVWQRINRPHEQLDLTDIMAGMKKFAHDFGGQLTTDTMLIAGVNDEPSAVQATAQFVATLTPSKAYLGIPTRPTADKKAQAPPPQDLSRAAAIFGTQLDEFECITGYEDAAFGITGDLAADLLGITAVHPMRRKEVQQLLAQAGADWQLVQQLLDSGQLKAVEHAGQHFIVRGDRDL